MEKAEELARTFIDDELISIELEDGGRFKVQKAILCGTSEYFRKAILGGFHETSSKTLTIPGCTSESFQMILYWICNSELPEWTADEDAQEDDYSGRSIVKSAQLCLAKLWLTGDMLLMGRLQNEAMRRLRSRIKVHVVSPTAMSWVFKSAPLDSPLRRALMEQVARDLISGSYTYSSEACDAFAIIPGFMKALLDTGERLQTKEHFHLKVPVGRLPDSEFDVPPPAERQ